MVSATASIDTKKYGHQVDDSQPSNNNRFLVNFNWQHETENRSSFCIGIFVGAFVLTAFASMFLFIPILFSFNPFFSTISNNTPCGNSCRIQLVESIPEGLLFNGTIKHLATFDVWKNLIENANSSIEIASFYWTLRENETYPHPSSRKGEEIFQALIKAGIHRNITIKIAQNDPSTFQPNHDTEFLQKLNAAEVRSLNFTQLVGAGVLHTKFWIVDRKHAFIGSPNMDWKALTQVKELGVVVYNCPCIAEDLWKIFDVYWVLGKSNEVPSKWPENFSTKYNANNPLNVTFNNQTNLVYISSSPPPFSPKGRNHDIDALLRTIANAQKFIYISVMDYFPLNLYGSKYKFWPMIDNEIRRAIIDRGVSVKILVSEWKSTRQILFNFMRSLNSLNELSPNVQVETKKFIVPSTADQEIIPYARVNHNKYMVTDNGLFIGTSNWSADYFTHTSGVSFVLTTNSSLRNVLREQLVDVFERDWNSSYAHIF